VSRALLPVLRRLRGWRLNLALVTGTVVGAQIVVALMDLLLHGEVTADYLLTGLVAACLVAPVSLGLLDRVLSEIYGRDRAQIDDSRQRTEGRLAMAIDVTQVVLWELDLATQRLIYDEAQLAVLGFDPHASLGTLDGWISRVHPEDRAPFVARSRVSHRTRRRSISNTASSMPRVRRTGYTPAPASRPTTRTARPVMHSARR
jgi:hypothetical protein